MVIVTIFVEQPKGPARTYELHCSRETLHYLQGVDRIGEPRELAGARVIVKPKK